MEKYLGISFNVNRPIVLDALPHEKLLINSSILLTQWVEQEKSTLFLSLRHTCFARDC